jgi:hypothetical protein
MADFGAVLHSMMNPHMPPAAAVTVSMAAIIPTTSAPTVMFLKWQKDERNAMRDGEIQFNTGVKVRRLKKKMGVQKGLVPQMYPMEWRRSI